MSDGGFAKEARMTIKLYSWPTSSGTRIAWALEELGVPYEYVELDAKNLEHRKPQYLAINPHGRVPGLSDGELTLFESGAMLLYLGDKHGVEKQLWPAGGGPAPPHPQCLLVLGMFQQGE
jgi:glutathione S-transferase